MDDWETMDVAALDDAYVNAAHIPGGDAYPACWAAAAAAFRQALGDRAEIAIPYGDHPAARFDLFHPDGPVAGLVAFVHGGYWMRFGARRLVPPSRWRADIGACGGDDRLSVGARRADRGDHAPRRRGHRRGRRARGRAGAADRPFRGRQPGRPDGDGGCRAVLRGPHRYLRPHLAGRRPAPAAAAGAQRDAPPRCGGGAGREPGARHGRCRGRGSRSMSARRSGRPSSGRRTRSRGPGTCRCASRPTATIST